MAGKNVRAGGLFVEIFTKDSRFVKGLRNASKKLKSFGASIAKAGAGVAAAGAAMLAPFAAALSVFTAIGDKLDKMSQRTRVSVESLSALGYAAERSGTTLESLGAALFRMTRRVANAASGTGPAVRALDELGISAAELTKLSPEDQMFAIVDALAKMENPLRANQMGFEIFGDNWKDLAPLLQNGSEAIKKLKKEAEDLGLVISTDTAKSAAAFSDALGKLKDIFNATMVRIGAAIAGPLTNLIEAFSKIGKPLADFLDANRSLIRIVAMVGLGLVLLGSALTTAAIGITVLGVVFGAAASALTLFGGVLAALFSPVALVAVAIGTVIAAVVQFMDITSEATGAISSAWQTGTEAVRGFFGELGEAISLAVQLLASGNISGAAQVLWAGLQVTWAKGVASIMQPWLEWKKAFLETAFSAWASLQTFLNTAWGGIQTGWNAFTFALVDTFDAVTSTMAQAFMGFVSTVASGLASVLRFVGLSDVADSIQATADSFAQSQKAEADARQKRNEQRLNNAAQQQNKIDAESAANLQRINEQRDKALEGLEIDNSAITEAEAAYADAQANFSAATTEANAAIEAAKTDKSEAEEKAEESAAAATMDVSKAKAAGTFSAASAARGGLFGGPVEKMSDGIQTLVKTAKQQLKQTKKQTADTFG